MRHFYHFNTQGHNVLTFDGREFLWDREHKARVAGSAFDNDRGGWWTVDTTALYEEVRFVRRTVVHLMPCVVVVLDEAAFEKSGTIRVRWHTETPAAPDASGAFRVENDGVILTGRVVEPDGGTLSLSHGRHRYEYDKDRMGNPYPQRREPFLDASMDASQCRVLSLFSVYGVDEAPGDWTGEGRRWEIDTPSGRVRVTVAAGRLTVACSEADRAIEVNLNKAGRR